VADRTENLGVSGEDLPELAARLKGVDISGASAIVLESGANDWLKKPVGDFRDRYAAVLAELPDRPLIAAAVLPVNEDQVMRSYAGAYDWRGANAAIAGWNDDIEALCHARPRCTFVPVPATLLSGDALNPVLSLDGVHLNAAGATIWSATLRHALGAPS
jgi:lysophospholipase L1-like esterase